MKAYQPAMSVCVVTLLCGAASELAQADDQIWPAPHGMFGVSVDDDDKLQVLEGIGSFGTLPGEIQASLAFCA